MKLHEGFPPKKVRAAFMAFPHLQNQGNFNLLRRIRCGKLDFMQVQFSILFLIFLVCNKNYTFTKEMVNYCINDIIIFFFLQQVLCIVMTKIFLKKIFSLHTWYIYHFKLDLFITIFLFLFIFNFL
jgi:hypothetical protein